MMLKQWFLETRPQFLLLSVFLVVHGSALAAWQGYFSWPRFWLSLLALLLLHASVNVLNDWHDFKSGIDRLTRRTPFSGGSGFLPAERLSPQGVLLLGLAALALGSGVGLVLIFMTGWPLLLIGLAGAFSVVAYTPLLTRVGLGEIFAGLGLGYLPILGVFYVHAGRLEPVAWAAAVPAGLLTFNLLLLNEFPDAEADASGGRRHLVIIFGKKKAGYIYTAAELCTYLWIVWIVAGSLITPWALLGLLALPLALRAVKGALRDYDSFEGLIPAQGANVGAVLATNVLLGIGYFVAAL